MTKEKLLELLKDIPNDYEIICLVDIADLKFYDEVIINNFHKVVVLQVNTNGE
jgi:hypothetical protein